MTTGRFERTLEAGHLSDRPLPAARLRGWSNFQKKKKKKPYRTSTVLVALLLFQRRILPRSVTPSDEQRSTIADCASPDSHASAMFGPKKGPPKPVPPKRRGAPPRKAKPTREEEEARRQQKYLDELGESFFLFL